MENIINNLQHRQLLHNTTKIKQLQEHLQETPRNFYVGFDPTSDSLHIGSLLPLLTMKRILQAGHKAILLLGGGTGLIGDPSGKTQERTVQHQDIVNQWKTKIKQQISSIFANEEHFHIIDNYEWLHKLDLFTYLRDIGKEFTVNYMLNKDSVASRITREDTGISYTEFSYMILQAYDFYHLYKQHNCTIQIGGSDQWGNITAGCELIRRKLNKTAHGITIPLVTKADGTKFGKTESGTIWLDKTKTSPYHFYQFWLNCADNDTQAYIDYFSLANTDITKDIKEQSLKQPEQRIGQKFLAEELTELLHGKTQAKQAKHITTALFNNQPQELTEQELDQLASDDITIQYKPQEQQTIPDLLVATKLVASKREARELIQNKAIAINGNKIDPETNITTLQPLHNKYHLITKGKKYHRIVMTCLP